MGTRGLCGFRIDNTDKVQYNHFDSYPGGLGADVLAFCRQQTNWEAMKLLTRGMQAVDEKVLPTTQQIARLKNYADRSVSTKQLTEWYVLLRHTQGKLGSMLAAGYFIDGADFIRDSLFCEWAYIVNLDTMMLECYKGFQTEPHTKGRYAALLREENRDKYKNPDGSTYSYHPCALVAEYPLEGLPTDEQMQREIDPPDPDEESS